MNGEEHCFVHVWKSNIVFKRVVNYILLTHTDSYASAAGAEAHSSELCRSWPNGQQYLDVDGFLRTVLAQLFERLSLEGALLYIMFPELEFYV